MQLRERIEVLELLLKDNIHEIDERLSSNVKSTLEMSNTEYGKFKGLGSITNGTRTAEGFRKSGEADPNSNPEDVYRELIHLRGRNKGLETRIK